ncbi:toxin-antitoxin system, antitoxin component, Xre domain protein [Ancylostoma caninum]|uniref:Toxin-antitoxin system, antitoxin component, Xre domain protein n=1 Tax=Ancylostoma caninum TaxID=29170 RepID=A0A368GRN1_ANCCA|nr:toxin-antitoxin system, antitoxin component, Xre domain protein [Ancylostoma caninum]
MRAFMLTEPEDDELDYPGESNAEEQTTSMTSNRSRISEPYKYDLQERLKETLERMRSTSFDNVSEYFCENPPDVVFPLPTFS